MIVINPNPTGAGTTLIYQLVKIGTNNLYIRSWTSSTWSKWDKIFISSDGSLLINGIYTNANNLNNVESTGTIIWSTDNVPENAPFNVGGSVLSSVTSDGNDITQIATSNTGILYSRAKHGSSWTEWWMLNNQNNLMAKGSITSDEDLNDYLYAGIYSWTSGSVPVNSPVSSAGTMVVINPNTTGAGTTLIYQLVKIGNNNLYIRSWTSSTWGEWDKFIYENDIKNTPQKYGTFGIMFNTSQSTFNVTRIDDSVNMDYNQTYDSVEGNSDFDNVYPWCDIKLCNIINEKVVYENETEYSEENNMFVEIPPFYFKREVNDNIETWEISYDEKPGFVLEPCFLNNDKITPVYVSCFEGGNYEENQYSIKNVFPQRSINYTTVKENVESNKFKMYDFETHMMLTHLMCIEYGEINVQKINKGVSFYPYRGNTTKASNTGEGNTVTVSTSNNTWLNVRTGDTIYFQITGSEELLGTPRTVLTAENNENNYTFTFDGDPISITANETYVYPSAQICGHGWNGLKNYSLREYKYGGSFSYRGIENIYGNTWIYCDGITYNDGVVTVGEETYNVPINEEVASYDNVAGNISKMHFDKNNKWIVLPSEINGKVNTKWCDELNELGNGVFFIGGGWDHFDCNGVFCMRSIALGNNWLYGYRVIKR